MPMKRVLIVVDMQNDFVTGALGTPEARTIEKNVVETILGFDGDIYFTLDTHGADYPRTQEGRRLPVAHCAAGTDGWSPTAVVWMALKERNVADERHMVCKETFGARDLPFRLHDDMGRDIDEITLVGVCTDICVISNALLLKAFFPEARLVVDAACCAGVTPESHQTALNAMRACQIDVV